MPGGVGSGDAQVVDRLVAQLVGHPLDVGGERRPVAVTVAAKRRGGRGDGCPGPLVFGLPKHFSAGDPPGTRTPNPWIKSPVLCQLS